MSITKNRLKQIKSLLTKKGRRVHQRFLAEGTRLLEEALRHDFRPEIVYYSPALCSDRSAELVNRMRRHGIVAEEVRSPDIKAMSDTDSPQGVIACFVKPSTSLSELSLPETRNILWCVDIADPGNLGTLLRSALAFGFEQVVLSSETADTYAPKVVRASAGALFGLKIVEASTSEMLHFIGRSGHRLIVADTRGEDAENLLNRPENACRLVVTVGSEAVGVGQQVLDSAHAVARIRFAPEIESLNAAVAGSILMSKVYEKTNK